MCSHLKKSSQCLTYYMIVFNSSFINMLQFHISVKQILLYVHVHMGALSYLRDVILSCPSLSGLNYVLKLCEVFAKDNCITFNTKKTVCIKYACTW